MLEMCLSRNAWREREVCGVERREEKGNVSFLILAKQGKTWRVLTPTNTSFPSGRTCGFCKFIQYQRNLRSVVSVGVSTECVSRVV